MTSFRVFLGAPLIGDLGNEPTEYRWENISSQSENRNVQLQTIHDFPTVELLDDASRRISKIYQNVIFSKEGDDEQDDSFEDEEDGRFVPATPGQTTVITWPPTAEDQVEGQHRFRGSQAELTFLDTTTRSSFDESPLSTQETQEAQSIDYSDASSIARFPTFHFNLHSLTSLTQFAKRQVPGNVKITTLLAILEVEGPDTIRVKNGRDAGKEVTILKMILGDEGGTICKLTAWREVAERWGGQQGAVGVKRGDIILIENVTAMFNLKSSPTLTASPFLKSSLTICYRTMPYSREDSRLRPDLRLGRSDAAVRKVATVVAWFQDLAGLGLQ